MTSIYLKDVPLSQAQARVEEALAGAGLWATLGSEQIPLDENALGRVLAEPVWARLSSPHYHAAAMDGFAVRADATIGAKPSNPIDLPVHEAAQYVDTGDPLPHWADAVVPIETVEVLDARGKNSDHLQGAAAVRVRAPVPPWSHVRPMGEDLVATQLVLPMGHSLRPVDLGAIAAAGHSELQVARRPRVAIIPTGSELVAIGTTPGAGSILEYNSLVMAAQVIAMGGEATRYPVVKDDFEAITGAVRGAAAAHDLVLLNAGSSAGSEDFSAEVIDRLGTVLIHGVAVRPGHPVIVGMLRRDGEHVASTAGDPSATRPGRAAQCPIIGVPGYPVSAALTVEIFVEPLLAKWLGRGRPKPTIEQAELTRKVTSPPGDDDYMRVTLGRVGDRLLAAPLSRGAGVITSLVQADGVVIVPSGSQGIEAGEEVPVRLYRSAADLDGTILCIGSHDLTLDLIAQSLATYDRRLVSANAGSQGGLIALRRKHAHLAGSHLLDPQTGEYNISYVRRYLPGTSVKIVALVGREQGLLVKAGNPKRIRSLEDLTRPDVRFVNRQRGAGTRVLLDYHLDQQQVPIMSINGYNHEEYTHLAVAAAVASERADCGLGIAAAAQALDLEFIPLFKERYDLVIPSEHARSPLLAPLFALLGRSDFREAVAKLPGYDVSVMGTVILEDQ